MLNAFTNQPLKVLTKDGLWYSMNTLSSIKNSYTRKLVLDSKGNKWIATPSIGVVGYKDNGTISDVSDMAFSRPGIIGSVLAASLPAAMSVPNDIKAATVGLFAKKKNEPRLAFRNVCTPLYSGCTGDSNSNVKSARF